MKSELKTIAASLVLAALSGQAGAAIQSGDHDKLPESVISSHKAIADTQDFVITGESSPSGRERREPDTTIMLAYSPAMSQASPSRIHDVLAPRLSGRASNTLNQPAHASPGFLLGANDAYSPGSPVPETRLTRSKGSVAANFRHAANDQSPAMTTLPVPEPDNWAVLLAGLFGVGAIARRRMSP